MNDLLRNHIEAMRAEPAERVLKPAIKAVVVIGILSTAALVLSEGYDRKGLARLAGDVQAPAKPVSKRP